jgi:tetratricopeptide (TPR) repeat protein
MTDRSSRRLRRNQPAVAGVRTIRGRWAARFGRTSLSLVIATAVALFEPGCRCFHYDQDGAISPEMAECRRCSHLAIAALDRGDADQAERLSSQAVKSYPQDAQARRYLAEAMWRRGKVQPALEQIEIARRLAPDDAALLVKLGEMHLSLDEWEAARAAAEQALDADSDLPAAWLLRGDTYRRSGRFDEALSDYTRALRLRPDDVDILRRLAVVSLDRQQPERALAYSQTLIDNYGPERPSVDVYDLHGQVLASLGRWSDAAECYAHAVDEQATPDRLYALAEAELLAGRNTAAETAVNRALTVSPGHVQSLALRERMQQTGGPRQLH